MRPEDRSEKQANPKGVWESRDINGFKIGVKLWSSSGDLLTHLIIHEAREMVSKGTAWVVNRSTVALCET